MYSNLFFTPGTSIFESFECISAFVPEDFTESDSVFCSYGFDSGQVLTWLLQICNNNLYTCNRISDTWSYCFNYRAWKWEQFLSEYKLDTSTRI